MVEALRFCVQPPQMPRTYACAFQRVRDECSGETWRRPHLGRAGRGRWRGWNAIGDEIPVGKGSSGGSRSSSKLWLCRRGSRVPSTSSFFRLLDVRESRGVPRPRSGGSEPAAYDRAHFRFQRPADDLPVRFRRRSRASRCLSAFWATATVKHYSPSPHAYHSFVREGVRQGARGIIHASPA